MDAPVELTPSELDAALASADDAAATSARQATLRERNRAARDASQAEGQAEDEPTDAEVRKARSMYGRAGYRDPAAVLLAAGALLITMGAAQFFAPATLMSAVYADSDAYAASRLELGAPAAVLRKCAALSVTLGLYAVYASGATVAPLRAVLGRTLAPVPLTPARQTAACGHLALAFALSALVNAGVIANHFRRTGSGGLDVRVYHESTMGAEALVYVLCAALLAQYAEQTPTRVEIGRLRVRTPAASDGMRAAYLVALCLGFGSGVVYMVRPRWIVKAQLLDYDEPVAMLATMDGFDPSARSAFGAVKPPGRYVDAMPRAADASEPGEALAAFRKLYPGKASLQTASMLAMDVGGRKLGALLCAEALLLLDMRAETSAAHAYTVHAFVTLRAFISTAVSFAAQASGNFAASHVTDGVTCLVFFVVYALCGRWVPGALRDE